jgi:CRISPR system Cascade subunit CasE
MYLSRLQLNPAHPSARRDLGSAYEMHRTLARAFVCDDTHTPARFLWRLERGADTSAGATVLVQAAQSGRWAALEADLGFLLKLDADKPVPLEPFIQLGRRYRFRLLANATVTREGKRYGLHDDEELIRWLARQGQRCGFEPVSAICSGRSRVAVSQGKTGHRITIDSALFEGVLRAMDETALRRAMVAGIGPGKALGMGLLSLAPLPMDTALEAGRGEALRLEK